MKKNIITIISIIICLIIVITGFYFLTKPKKDTSYYEGKLHKTKKNVYCSEGFCYRITKDEIQRESTDEENPEFIMFDSSSDSCKIDECHIKIYSKEDDLLILKKGEDYHFYYPYLPYKKERIKLNLQGKLYTNKEVEFYFLNNEKVIISGKEYPQNIQDYTAYKGNDTYSIIYTSYYQISTNVLGTDLLYFNDTNEIEGYKEIDIKDSKYINLDYYDEEGNIKDKNKYIKEIEGAYIGEDTYWDEVLIENNELSVASKNTEYTYNDNEIFITDVNDKYIYISSKSTWTLLYDRDKKLLLYLNTSLDDYYDKGYNTRLTKADKIYYQRVSKEQLNKIK